MAKFVKLYAKDMNVGLNDIGMVCYYTNNKIIDLWGVANIEVAKSMRNGSFSTAVIDELAKNENMRLVICYQPWFEHSTGRCWKRLLTTCEQNTCKEHSCLLAFFIAF